MKIVERRKILGSGRIRELGARVKNSRWKNMKNTARKQSGREHGRTCYGGLNEFGPDGN